MNKYSYQARDDKGLPTKGVVEAMNQSQAVKTLQEHGLFVTNLTEKKEFSFSSFSIGKSGPSGGQIATFTRLLATMLHAGLPLIDALNNLVYQQKEDEFKEILSAILHDVQSGTSLSSSMEKFPKAFNNLYVSLVRAGEASGKVDETLDKLAEMLEAEQSFRGKIKGAMIYPIIIVLAMIGVSIFMITTIIPKIASIYKEFNADLPLPTQILIAISNLVTNYTIFVVIFLGLLYYLYRTFKKNPASEYFINNALFKFPVLGPMNVEVNLTIMCRTLGTLVASGVSILDSLKIVAQAMPNSYFRAGIEDGAQAVEKGLPLSEAFHRTASFPMILPQLVAIGEETGTLDQSLMRVANFYQESAERKVNALTTALEPIMIILMGVMVGGLAVAVLLPMFNLVNVIK